MKNHETHQDVLRDLLKNKEFKESYEELKPEYEIHLALIKARNKMRISQLELSRLSGIDQANLSRIEKGIANPSLHTLQRLAKAMGMHIELKFVENK